MQITDILAQMGGLKSMAQELGDFRVMIGIE